VIKVDIQVSNGALGPTITTVRAESIGQALCIADGMFPGGEARVVFPIEPEAFFAGRGEPGPVETRPLGRVG